MTNKADDRSAHYETQYRVGQDNVLVLGLDVHNPVFAIAAVSVIVFVIFTLIFQEQATIAFGNLRPWLTTQFDWVFMIAVNFFVLFCIGVALSPLGRVTIGGKQAVPEYSYLSWFSMMFAAGLGIGLMFYGVLEPVNHFLTPPLGEDSPNAQLAMAATLFHWALHPWAIYATVGLAIALFCYSKGLPQTIRSAFYPLLGERVWGWMGNIIDVLAVFATLFGIATTLGYGAEQASAGLAHLYGIPSGNITKVALIVIITLVAVGSVVRGLDGGVKRLSEINLILAAFLCLFVIAAGDTLDILIATGKNAIDYVVLLPELSNWIDREDTGFVHGWTTFYWAWWIAWSPFVGMFIARISRGRTVREFLLCTLVLPSLACIVWMTAFGGSAIDQYLDDGVETVIAAVQNAQLELSLFRFLESVPFTGFFSALAIALIVIFFVTSMDSGSLVVDTITAGGKIDAPTAQRIFWCVFEGLIAIALLLGGGLASLQALALATAFPFTLIILLMCWSVLKVLREEARNSTANPPPPSAQKGQT